MPRFESKLVPPEKRQEFLHTAREQYSFAALLDSTDKALALDDAVFALAEPRSDAGVRDVSSQWTFAAAQSRIEAKRPCLTENRLLTFTAQVVNDGRQSKPSISITAMDDGNKATAEYFQGRIRQIEYDSNADIAYDSAREQQVTCGRGFIRVNWEYKYKSFQRQLVIERIENQFSVLFGPAKKYDCSDADHCFVINAITRDEHERKYGKETTAAHTDFTSVDNPCPGWFGVGPAGDMVQEAEYWVKTYKERTLALLTDGSVQWKDEIEIPEGMHESFPDALIEEERQEKDWKVVQYIIDGADILDEHEFPGAYIPIVPVWGREYFLDGRRRTLSLIRQAKDPQRLLNIYVSNIAEQIGMMPKTPFWVPLGAIPAGAQADYDNLNNRPKPYVPYNQYDLTTGKELSRPLRETNEPPIVALVQGYSQCVDAIKAAMGIYDASLGNVANETSGIAIQSRQHQSDNANFHFHDNEARSRNHLGRILLPLIREMDKGVGTRPIRSVDGKTRLVRTGVEWRDPELKQTVHHKLDEGDYGVAVSTAPSYTSQRDEAFDALTKMADKWPALLEIGGPTILRLANFPGSEKLADLMEKTLPPALQTQNGQDPIPPAVMAQFEHVQQQAALVINGLRTQLEEAQGTIQKLQTVISGKVIEMEGRKQIQEMQDRTAALVAEIGTKVQQQSERQQLFADLLKEIRDNAHEAGMAAQNQAHQAGMAALDAETARQQQAAEQQHQVNLQTLQQQHQAALQQNQQQAQQPDAPPESQQPTE